MRGLMLVAVLFLAARALAMTPPGYQLVWEDRFSGSALDASKWNIDTKKRDDALQSTDAVSVHDGVLSIRTFTENGVNHTGFLTTSGKFEAAFGYYETRIVFHPAAGEWCAFWLQSNTIGNPLGDPAKAGVEVDIVEHRGVNDKGVDISNTQSINMHWDGYSANHKHIGSSASPDPSGPSLAKGWHDYGVLWTPTSYTYYLDGKKVWSTTSPVSQVPEHIRLTCEIRNHSWAGSIPQGGYPTRAESQIGMDVSRVRYFKK